MKRILLENGLSIVLAAFFLAFIVGQSLAGRLQYNEERSSHGQAEVSYPQYLVSNHFLEATMENWESEFLQMFVYVIFTIFLFQKGSSESKKIGEKAPVDKEPVTSPRKKSAPGPVRRGGFILKLYKHSLSLAFLLFFLISFALHAVGGVGKYNEEQLVHGEPAISLLQFLGTSQFWFESFQNWQSEFLAILSMVVLSIFLRQKGSPESKPVDAPHSETEA